MDDGVEEVAAVPELDNLRPSPEQRTNVVLRLLEEVATIGVEENNHDLQLFFLDFDPPVLADLHRHIPALATMEKTLAHASLVLGLAASTGPTRSAQQQQRVEDAIRAKGPDFLRALGRYRIDPTPLVEPNDQFLALLNFFQYGRQILQHAIFHSAALRQMVDSYVELIPKVNQISDSQKLTFWIHLLDLLTTYASCLHLPTIPNPVTVQRNRLQRDIHLHIRLSVTMRCPAHAMTRWLAIR